MNFLFVILIVKSVWFLDVQIALRTLKFIGDYDDETVIEFSQWISTQSKFGIMLWKCASIYKFSNTQQ